MDRLYNMLSDENSFHMKNMMSFFITDEHSEEIPKKTTENVLNSLRSEPKSKFQSVMFESAFKEISNIKETFRSEMKNEGNIKKENAHLNKNMFLNTAEFSKKQTFSETFKMIEEIWTKIKSRPQNKISKNFCLKSFVFL